jgi:hypothetical protein
MWEPLFARYEPGRVLPVARRLAASGRTKLQLLLDEAGAVALPLAAQGDDDALTDWDAMGDLPPVSARGKGPS